MVAISTTTSRKSPLADDLLNSTRPLGFAGGDENLKRYVGNHPTYATDPTGLAEGDPPSIGDIDDDALSDIIKRDPLLNTIGEPQRTALLQQLRNVRSAQFKFAAELVLLTSNFSTDDFGKKWWLIGPGDQHYPGNVGGDYKTTYNCLGHLLSWYGTTKFNGKDVSSNGRATWPDIPDVFAVGDLNAQLGKFDALFASLGRRGFERMDWKPVTVHAPGSLPPRNSSFQERRNWRHQRHVAGTHGRCDCSNVA